MKTYFLRTALTLAFLLLPFSQGFAAECTTDITSSYPTDKDWREAYTVQDDDGAAWQKAILSAPVGITVLNEEENTKVKGTAEPYSQVQVYVYTPVEDEDGNFSAPTLATCLWQGEASESGFFVAEIHPRILWNLIGQDVKIESFFRKKGGWHLQSQQETNQDFFIGTHIEGNDGTLSIQADIHEECTSICPTHPDENIIKLQKSHIITPLEFTDVLGDNFDGLGFEDILLGKAQHTFYAGKQSGYTDAIELSEISKKTQMVEILKQILLGEKEYLAEPLPQLTKENIENALNQLEYSEDTQELTYALDAVMTDSSEKDAGLQKLEEMLLEVIGCEAPECIQVTQSMLDEVLTPAGSAMNPNSTCTNTTDIRSFSCPDGIKVDTKDMYVLGTCASPNTSNETVQVSQAGTYSVTGFVRQGTMNQCQVGEEFTLSVNQSSPGPVVQDDPNSGMVSERMLPLGTFYFNSGNNSLQMTTASNCPDGQADSVHLQDICITLSQPALNCTLNANPNSFYAGESSTLNWTSTGAASATLNNGIGSVETNGSRIVNPTTSTTYTLTVTSSDGQTDTCSTSVSVNAPLLPDFDIEKQVSADGTSYSEHVTLDDEETAFYRIIVQNNGNGAGDVSVQDAVGKATNGGQIGNMNNIAIDCPTGSLCNGFLHSESGLNIDNLQSGDQVTIEYQAQADADGIPAGQTSDIPNVALLSSGKSDDALVTINSALKEVEWLPAFLEILKLWTGKVQGNMCIFPEEEAPEFEKHFQDNSQSHDYLEVCDWEAIYTNGYSSPAIIIHSEEEVLLQPNFDEIQMAEVDQKFTPGKKGWVLTEEKKDPIFYRYEAVKSLENISLSSVSCLKENDLEEYAAFLAEELELLPQEQELIVEEIAAQLHDEYNGYFRFSIGNPKEVGERFGWNINEEEADIAQLFFSIEEGMCEEKKYRAPENGLKKWFTGKPDGFEVGVIE